MDPKDRIHSIDRLCDRYESSWQRSERPGIAEYLEQLPDVLRGEAVGELLAIDLAYRRQQGESPSRSDYQPVLKNLAGFLDSETARLLFDDTLESRQRTGRNQDGLFPGMTDDEMPELPGLKPVRKLGSGGMGLVILAEQTGLGRLVAVKMIRSGAWAGREELSRFRAEMEAAASLRHPGIVQIFQFGQHLGQPYQILEYFPQGSLRDHLRGRPQDVRLAARMIADLATALEHAHQRGIIHRDLKPANILVDFPDAAGSEGNDRSMEESMENSGTVNGTVGNTLAGDSPHGLPKGVRLKIADFGLARRTDSTQSAGTETGAILGTPAYLSPEQASGHSHEAGPASDIYSLGVVLYEMLTGRPPHQGSDAIETLQLIRTREPVSPRSLRPEVPRDLETICLRCLAVETEGRFRNAAGLAEDLHRFLENRPVTARPVGRLERTWRWCRRERRVALLGLAAALALVMGAGLAGGIWSSSQRQAKARFLADLQDVDQRLSLIERDEFSLVPRMDDVRRLMLEGLAGKCRDLLDQGIRVPLLHRQVARVHAQLGMIQALLGNFVEARAALQLAASIQSETVSGPDSEPADRMALAGIRTQIARVCQTVGDYDEAERALVLALDLFESMPEGPGVAAGLGAAMANLAELQVMTGRLVEGEKSYRVAIGLLDQRGVNQDSADSQLELARAKSGLALLLIALSRLDEAVGLSDSAINSLEQRVASSTEPGPRLQLVRALSGRARAWELLDRADECAADLLRAHETAQRLAAEYPGRPEYRIESSLALQKAARQNQQLAEEQVPVRLLGPNELDPQMPSIERRLRNAMGLQRELSDRFPAVVENRRLLAVTMNELATWLGDKSTYLADPSQSAQALAEAERLHRESHGILQDLVVSHPMLLVGQMDLARSDQRFSIVLARLGQLDEAEAMLRDSVARQTRLAELYPQVFAHQMQLMALYCNLGAVRDQSDDSTSSEECYRIALTYGETAGKLNPFYPPVRVVQAAANESLADLLIRSGRYTLAVPCLDAVDRLWPHEYWWSYESNLGRWQQLYNSVRGDDRMSRVERENLCLLCEDRSLELVRQLTLTASINREELPNWLNTVRVLDHVRSRKEFRELELAAKRRAADGQ